MSGVSPTEGIITSVDGVMMTCADAKALLLTGMTESERRIAEIALLPYKGTNAHQIAEKIAEDAKKQKVEITAKRASEVIDDLVRRNILTMRGERR